MISVVLKRQSWKRDYKHAYKNGMHVLKPRAVFGKPPLKSDTSLDSSWASPPRVSHHHKGVMSRLLFP